MPCELNFLKPHSRDKSPDPCVGEEPTNPILRQADELGTKALVKQVGNNILFVGLESFYLLILRMLILIIEFFDLLLKY